MLKTQAHIDLMTMFEVEYKGRRLAREDRSQWPKCHIYQDGAVNELFLAYRRGYAYGIAIPRP